MQRTRAVGGMQLTLAASSVCAPSLSHPPPALLLFLPRPTFTVASCVSIRLLWWCGVEQVLFFGGVLLAMIPLCDVLHLLGMPTVSLSCRAALRASRAPCTRLKASKGAGTWP